MGIRGHRLGLFAALVIVCVWTSTAHATQVSVNPSTVNTPATDIGVKSAGATTVFSTSDGGNPKVEVLTGTCTGAGMGTFEFNPNMNISLNSDPTITVKYTPTTAGAISCNVDVFNQGQAPNGSVQKTFTVTGYGNRPPQIALGTISKFPAARVYDLCDPVNVHATTRTITVTNNGDKMLNISSVGFSTTEFYVDSTSATTAPVAIAGNGGSRTFTLGFNPSTAGVDRTAVVTFNSDDPVTPMKTVSVFGDGTTGDFTLDMGNGQFGTVASGSSATYDITVTHSGGSPKGPLKIESVTITNATQAWFSISGQPSSLSSGTPTGTVTVTCAVPALSTATATATISIVADADGFPGTAYKALTKDVSCTGGTSVLAFTGPTGAMIDFGAQLVGTTTAPMTLVLTNSGTTQSDVAFNSLSANRMRFGVATPGSCGLGSNPACMLPMTNGSVTISATFSPTTETSVSAGFIVNATGGGAAPGFVLSGRGIDRHIVIPETLQAPDTFRNPGTNATKSPIAIRNDGEYPIIISELTLNGDADVWQVVDTQLPLMIPGLASVDVMIQFAPHVAGKASDAQLLVANDDPKIAGGMPIIVLSGNGKDRNVDMAPGSIDVGDTFAGVPTRLSITKPMEMFKIVNMEDPDPDTMKHSTDFTMREIKVHADCPADATTCDEAAIEKMFEVVDFSSGDSVAGHMINAKEELRVDVIFKPTFVGDFNATIELYLDEDTQPQRPVPIHGRALFVDAHGSGGCSTGRGSRGAMLFVIGVLVVVLRRRRR